MKKKTTKPKRSTKPASRAKSAKGKPAKPKAPAKGARNAAAKSKPAKAARKSAAKTPTKKPAKKASGAQWVKFVQKHGVVLASARGPVPSVAEAVAGEPIVGSWWAHPKGNQIFDALSAIDDSPDIRCFKLVDGKVTFVHRAVWPALVRLGREGVLSGEQLAAVQQEHTETGEHRNVITAFPDWVDPETGAQADDLSADQARAKLSFIDG